MRGWTVTIIIIVVAAVVVGLFHFLFKNQMDKKVDELQAQNATLEARIKEIAAMEASIEPMKADIPRWKEKVKVYRAAVPAEIEDHNFFAALRTEMKAAGVQLLNVKVDPGGQWLGDIKEEEAKKLEGIGVDVDAARALKVAFYSIELVGPYGQTLAVLENLKRHGRMYSIDAAMGPAGSGAGTISQVLDPNSTPIQVVGKIFYGIPDDYVSEAQLNHVFAKVVLQPLAGQTSASIKSASQQLTAGKE
jgi:hypothetical protein